MSLKLPDSRAEFSHKVAGLYQERREEAVLRGEQRRRMALAQSPRLQEADLALRAAGARQLAASIAGGDKLVPAQRELAEARDRRNMILREEGYDERFDMPDYSCRFCEDTGMVDGRRCRCYAEAVYPILLEESQLEAYSDQTFADFRAELFCDRPDKNEKEGMPSPREMHVRLKDAMLKYCADFETATAKSLFFHGRTGTGKTFIATAIGHELIRNGHSVFFLSFSEMMQQLQQYRILTSSFNPDPVRLEQAERFYQQIHNTDLLILDDLGSGIGDGGVHASELLSLMNSRFSQKKPMLITTNLDTVKIQKLYDERLLSRLLGSFVPVYFYGDDVRTIRRRR